MNYVIWYIYYVQIDVCQVEKLQNESLPDVIAFRSESLLFTLSPRVIFCDDIKEIDKLCANVMELENRISHGSGA